MGDESDCTRDIAAFRKKLLNDWFEEIQRSGDWKKWVNNSGKLKASKAKRHLYELETGEDGEWSSDYFKGGHWSQLRRVKFEEWVVEKLKKTEGYDLFGAPVRGNLGLPIWLDDEPLTDDVRGLIVELAEGRKADKEKIKDLQNRLDKRERKLLEMETRERRLDERHTAINGHYQESVRTLRYNAGIDIDLSQGGLFEKNDPPSPQDC